MPEHYIRRSNSIQSVRGPAGIGFKLTQDGNYDINHKQLINVGKSIDLTSAVNKKYVDEKIILDPNPNNLLIRTENGLLLNDETLLKGDKNLFDCKQKRLVNVDEPEDDNDAATKHYIDKNLNTFLVVFGDIAGNKKESEHLRKMTEYGEHLKLLTFPKFNEFTFITLQDISLYKIDFLSYYYKTTFTVYLNDNLVLATIENMSGDETIINIYPNTIFKGSLITMKVEGLPSEVSAAFHQVYLYFKINT